MMENGQEGAKVGADYVSIFGPGWWLQGFVLFVIIHQGRQNDVCLCFYVCVSTLIEVYYLFIFKAANLSLWVCQGICIYLKILVMVIKPPVVSATGNHGEKDWLQCIGRQN